MGLFDFKISAEEYLTHSYSMPEPLPKLPLTGEEFVQKWRKYNGQNALEFLEEEFLIDTKKYDFEEQAKITLTFTSTMGGNLPVIFTSNHEDFIKMESLLNGRDHLREIPLTVNAFTIQARNERIYQNRIILLNEAPYSNVSADKLSLKADEWLKRSYKLRLRHESAHYETLRILGGMKNHALDEILADALGQIAAFGNFNAARQRIFFGLHGDKCDGRLQFYCQKVEEDERHLVYRAVNEVLDIVERKICEALSEKLSEINIFCMLAGQSIEKLIKSGGGD